jgi:hypothetical protein
VLAHRRARPAPPPPVAPHFVGHSHRHKLVHAHKHEPLVRCCGGSLGTPGRPRAVPADGHSTHDPPPFLTVDGQSVLALGVCAGGAHRLARVDQLQLAPRSLTPRAKTPRPTDKNAPTAAQEHVHHHYHHTVDPTAAPAGAPYSQVPEDEVLAVPPRVGCTAPPGAAA